MNELKEPKLPQTLASLPRPWSTAVQLVGTFGLAVFLVLYYVLVMQPRERARYDELRKSVESLISVVESGQTLITKDQAKRLESLYVVAMANEMGVYIHEALQKATGTDELEGKINQMMLNRTVLLEGLKQKGGKNISETIVHRLAGPGRVSQLLAKEAANWNNISVQDISKKCEGILESYFADTRRKK